MANEKPKGRRQRSPISPYINLAHAIGLIRTLHEKEGYNYTPVNVVLEHLNYSPTSSSGHRVLATLRQFGLLDEMGTGNEKSVRLSDLSMTIIEAPDEETRLAAIQEAALSPDIHKELWEYWNLAEQQLPSESAMRYRLLREVGFHKNAVDGFIEQFKDTYSFAALGRRNKPQFEEEVGIEEASSPANDPMRYREVATEPTPISALGMREHTIQLIGQPMARLILPHPISQRNLDHLVRWLQLMGPALTVPEDEFGVSTDQFDDENSV